MTSCWGTGARGQVPPEYHTDQPGARASPWLSLQSASQEHKNPQAMATTQGSLRKKLPWDNPGWGPRMGPQERCCSLQKNPLPKRLLVNVGTAIPQGPGFRQHCTSQETLSRKCQT